MHFVLRPLTTSSIYISGKYKVKPVPKNYVTKAYRGRRRNAPPILDLSSRRCEWSSFTFQPFYVRGKSWGGGGSHFTDWTIHDHNISYRVCVCVCVCVCVYVCVCVCGKNTRNETLFLWSNFHASGWSLVIWKHKDSRMKSGRIFETESLYSSNKIDFFYCEDIFRSSHVICTSMTYASHMHKHYLTSLHVTIISLQLHYHQP
jgi:hypothetical protein